MLHIRLVWYSLLFLSFAFTVSKSWSIASEKHNFKSFLNFYYKSFIWQTRRSAVDSGNRQRIPTNSCDECVKKKKLKFKKLFAIFFFIFLKVYLSKSLVFNHFWRIYPYLSWEMLFAYNLYTNSTYNAFWLCVCV